MWSSGLILSATIVALFHTGFGMICSKRNLKKVYRLDMKHPYIMYGIRSDGAVFVRPVNTFDVFSSDAELRKLASKNYAAKLDYFKVFMIKIDRRMQLLAAIRRKGENVTRVRYVPEFKMKYAKDPKRFLIEEKELEELFYVSFIGNPYNIYDEQGTLFGYCKGHEHKTKYFFKLGKDNKKLMLAGSKNVGGKPSSYRYLESMDDLMGNLRHDSEGNWISRNYKGGPDDECIFNFEHAFEIKVIISRSDHNAVFGDMGGPDFRNVYIPPDFRNVYTREENLKPPYDVGAVFIGVYKNLLFFYRVDKDPSTGGAEKFTNILSFLESKKGLKDPTLEQGSEEIRLFSIDGEATFVIIIPKEKNAVYYGVINTNAYSKWKKMACSFNRKDFMVYNAFVKDGTFVDADCDPMEAEMTITVQTKEGFSQHKISFLGKDTKTEKVALPIPRPMLIDYGNNRSSRPRDNDTWHVFRKNVIRRTVSAITLTDQNQREFSLTKIARSAFRCLLYFPEPVAKALLDQAFKEDLPPIYGVIDCTFFIFNVWRKISDLGSIVVKKGCNYENIKLFANGRDITILEGRFGQAIVATGTVKMSSTNFTNGYAVDVEEVTKKFRISSFAYRLDAFDQIFTDRRTFHYPVEGAGLPFEWETIGVANVKGSYQMELNSLCWSTCELRQVFYEPTTETIFYEVITNDEVQWLSHNAHFLHRLTKLPAWRDAIQKGKIVSLYGDYLTYRVDNFWSIVTLSEGITRTFFLDGAAWIGYFPGNVHLSVEKAPKTVGAVKTLEEIEREKKLEAELDVSSTPQFSGNRGVGESGGMAGDSDHENATVDFTTPEPPPIIFEDVVLNPVEQMPEPVICPPYSERAFFFALSLKLPLLDGGLLLILIALVMIHRMMIIPARRRYKIIRGILKTRKEKTLRARARKRLRRLNILHRRREHERHMTEKKSKSSSSSSEAGVQVTCLPLTTCSAAPTVPVPSADGNALATFTAPQVFAPSAVN